MSTTKIDGRHIIAARGLLRMTQQDLADAAGVSKETILRVENSRTVPHAGTMDAIRAALERRGIEFMNGDRPGVRLHPDQAIYPV
jgi:transcriptional regulator with XRE-family HTH domain